MNLALIDYNATESTLPYATSTWNVSNNISDGPTVTEHVVFWAFVDGFLFFAIVTGNVLTVAAILVNRGISHIISNHFILSLACSDLFVGLMLPYHMMFYIKPRLGEQFAFCIARLALVSLACIASVMNIIGIAIDRFLAVVYPLHYNKLMTKRLARSLAVIAWVVAISISATPIFWNKWKDNAERSTGRCVLGYVVVPLFVKTIYLPSFLLLFTIMLAFYVKIFTETKKHAERMRHCRNNPPDTWKSLQVLMLVMGSFTISYTPFIVVVILNSLLHYNTKTMSIIYKMTITLAMANSAVNPLIYAWKSQGFKKAFWKIVNCKKADKKTFPFPKRLRMRRNTKCTCTVTPDNKTLSASHTTTVEGYVKN